MSLFDGLFNNLFGFGSEPMPSRNVSVDTILGGQHGGNRQADQTNTRDPDDGADPGAGGPAPRGPGLFAGLAAATGLAAASGPDLIALARQNALARLIQAQQANLQQQLHQANRMSGLGMLHQMTPHGSVRGANVSLTVRPPHDPTELETEAIVAGEIVAWRIWRPDVWSAVQAPQLMSLACAYRWAPGMIAEGDPARGFGVHAFKDKGWMLDQYRGACVFGEVSLWGDVIEHEHGYRASHAKIKSLALCRLASAKDVGIEYNLRSYYGVGAPSA